MHIEALKLNVDLVDLKKDLDSPKECVNVGVFVCASVCVYIGAGTDLSVLI